MNIIRADRRLVWLAGSSFALVALSLGAIIVLDDAIVVTSRRAERGITNGIAYDRATLRTDVTCVILPGSTRTRVGTPGKVVLHLKKELLDVGHPGGVVTPHLARRSMGSAWRVVDGCLALDLFGQASGVEGGASISLVADLPPGTRVERVQASDRFAGAGSHPEAVTWAWEHRGKGDWWYTAPEPAPGWIRIRDRPARIWERRVWDPVAETR